MNALTTLQVPDRDREMLVGLLSLDRSKGEQLVAAIDQSEGTFAGIAELIEKFGLNGRASVGALMSLMVVGRQYRIGTKTLVSSLRDSFSADADGSGLELLLNNAKIKRFAKAYALRNEYERILTDSRIMSDIRPIFDDDNSPPSIQGATVNHTLRFTYRAGDGDDHELHFALDAEDLKKLKAQIDRALDKDQAAQDLLKSANVDVLGPIEKTDTAGVEDES